DMSGDRVIPQHRVASLGEIAKAEQRQRSENNNRNHDQLEDLVIDNPNAEEQRGDDTTNRKNDETRRERKQQRFHGTSQANLVRLKPFRRQPNPKRPTICTEYPPCP